MSQPFLFNEVFAPNRDLRIDGAGIDGVPAAVVDNFLQAPDKAREVAANTPATNWKMVPDGRNFVDYYDCRLRFPVVFPNPLIDVGRRIVQEVYGHDTRPQNPCVDVNWFKQVNPRRADFANPHHDIVGQSERSFTCLLYLNNVSECSGGTSFFRFRGSGSLVADRAYHEKTQQDPRIVESGADYWPVEPELFWERVGDVAMQPGRLIVFPSEFFHAAWHPEDSFKSFPRLTLAFWLVK